jgi:hypothetical protein
MHREQVNEEPVSGCQFSVLGLIPRVSYLKSGDWESDDD